MDDELGLAAHNLALNLSFFRHRRGARQESIALHTGIPRSTIAQLETGNGNPTLSHLLKLSAALEVTIEELISAPRGDTLLLRSSEIPFTEKSRGEAKIFKLLPDPIQGIEFDRLELKAGSRLSGAVHNSGTREYFTVTKGVIEVATIGEKAIVSEGDVFAFPGEYPHSYKNLTEKVSIGISVIVFGRRMLGQKAGELRAKSLAKGFS